MLMRQWQETLKWLRDCIIVILFAFFCGILLSAWAYLPRPIGVDMPPAVYKIKFLLEYWPGRWNYQWAEGMPLFNYYPSFWFYATTLIVKLTHYPVELVMISLILASYCMTAMGSYGFTFEITNDRAISIVASFLTMASSFTWRFYVVGGQYARAVTTMFLPLSLWLTMRVIKNLNSNTPSRKTLVAAILTLAIAMLGHQLIGILTLGSILFMMLFCVRAWKERIFGVLKLCIPALLICFYFYLPFMLHPMPGVKGFFEPYRGPFRGLTLSQLFLSLFWKQRGPGLIYSVFPLLLSTTLTLTLLVVVLHSWPLKENERGYLKFLGIMSFIWILWPLLGAIEVSLGGSFFHSYMYSWLKGGETLFFLPFYLAPFSGLLLKRVLTHFFNYRKIILSLLLCGIIVLVPITWEVNPFVKIMNPGFTYVESGYFYAINRLVIDNNETMFRAYVPEGDSGLGAWFNLVYDVPQTRDYCQEAVLNRHWRAYLEYGIWNSSSYEEASFLFDWFAVKWILVRPGIHSPEKFYDQEEHYSFVTNSSGDHILICEFIYKHAAPIVSATNVPSMLVIGNDVAYVNVFQSLVYSNYNSGYVTPVRGNEYIDSYTLEELSKFDVLFLYNYKYYEKDTAWNLLQQYVNNGGGLIVETMGSPEFNASSIPLPCPVNRTIRPDFGYEWDFTAVDSPVTHEVDFSAFSPAIYNESGTLYPWGVSASYDGNIRSWAKAALYDQGHPIVVAGRYGKGYVVWSGLNIPHHVTLYKNYWESLFISKMIDWVSRVSEKTGLKVDYTVNRQHPEKVTVTIYNKLSGALFKECYFKNWYTYLIDADGKKYRLDIYRAGPDFMYVRIPKDIKFPAKVIFEYGVTWDEWIGKATSITTLILLIMYAVGLPIDKPAKYLIKKLGSPAKKIKEWGYKE